MNRAISNKKEDFINIPIDKETLESIARVKGCHYNDFNWCQISQYVKDTCLSNENYLNNIIKTTKDGTI